MTDNYIVVKLVSGEQIISILENEDDTAIDISFPMVIKTIPVFVNGQAGEHVTAAPFCALSKENKFHLEKKNIVYIKPLHKSFLPHYQRMLSAYDEVTIKTNQQPQPSLEEVWEEEVDKMSTEEIKKRIDMLESIFNGEETQEEEKPEPTYVRGNDTIH